MKIRRKECEKCQFMTVVSLRGWVMISRQRWETQFSRIPQMPLSFVINFGQGRRATRMKVRLDDFMQTSAWMFARLRRTGWAVRSPVMTEILVLSEERIMPRSVAPSGSIS